MHNKKFVLCRNEREVKKTGFENRVGKLGGGQPPRVWEGGRGAEVGRQGGGHPLTLE